MATRRTEEERARALSLRHGRLADGMAIGARIRARLFGLRLLQLDAKVTVLPTSPRVRGRARLVRGEEEPGTRNGDGEGSRARSNGRIGGGLADAERTLEATTTDLREARERMPAGPNGSSG